MVVKKRYLFTAIGVLFSLVEILSAQSFPVEKIAVGAIFDQNTEEVQNVFKYALAVHNQNISSRRLELQAYVDVINTADAFKLSRLICNQFARGVFAMLGAVTPESFDTLHSYTNTFQMPFVTPWFPEKVNPPSSGLIDHAVSMRPDYHRAIVDTIVHYGWKEIIYMYDSHDGKNREETCIFLENSRNMCNLPIRIEAAWYVLALSKNGESRPMLSSGIAAGRYFTFNNFGLLRLQQLYQGMQPGRTTFKIYLVRRIYNTSDAMDFLVALEDKDRWNNKHIVLDCSARNAKNILIEHVRRVELGRRTYHYILSGLVMDDYWENEVTEYGVVNVTGFRIVDQSKKVVRDFMDGLRRIDPRFKGTVSAQTALMYDGVQVLMDALGRLWKKKPEAFRNALRRTAALANSTKVIDCNPGKSWVVPFEHGDKISRLIKKTDIEGLTGNISFNEEGHRCNFTLHVVEMTVQSAMVKVASWTDRQGLKLVVPKYIQIHSPSTIETNRTYTVTTILQEPFMMLKPAEYGQREDEFEGFCKELADLITSKLGIKYEIRVVRDGMFGSEQSNHAWSGLVGEVFRKEVDMAIAPLSITPEREKVIDFSEPFLSIKIPIKRTRIPKQLGGTFSFLRPLSKEIWLCVIFSFFAVSIVLFLVSRFSPHEWRSVSVTDSQLENPGNTNEIILHNEFSIWNSFWFSLGSFMQQGSDVVPRSLSGRIVGTVWWFFALILICSYTANLAAYLIVERITDPAILHYESRLYNEDNTADKSNLIGDTEAKDGAFNYHEYYRSSDSPLGNSCRYKMINFGIATAKGSPLREGINLAIVSLKRDGVISKLWRKWLLTTNKPDCDLVKDEETTITEMTLSQVSGIFYVLLGGLALALSVALVEFCQHGRSEAARANVPLRTALRANSRRNTNERKTPQRTPQREQDRLGWNGAAFAGYFPAGTQISHEDAVHASFTHV